jgi:hypothetical protein
MGVSISKKGHRLRKFRRGEEEVERSQESLMGRRMGGGGSAVDLAPKTQTKGLKRRKYK